MKRPIRILIADDHEVVRRGLILVLSQEPDFEIVGEARNGAEALELLHVSKPDLVLLDWKMPKLDGLKAARQVKLRSPETRTLLLSGAPVESAALDALDNGVDGFVHKDITPNGLAHAIRVTASGKTFLGTEVSQALLDRSRRLVQQPNKPIKVSPRELEVLKLMSSAATYRDIAAQLTISETTVRTHVKRILVKLDQPNRTQAVVAALRLGLISFD